MWGNEGWGGSRECGLCFLYDPAIPHAEAQPTELSELMWLVVGSLKPSSHLWRCTEHLFHTACANNLERQHIGAAGYVYAKICLFLGVPSLCGQLQKYVFFWACRRCAGSLEKHSDEAEQQAREAAEAHAASEGQAQSLRVQLSKAEAELAHVKAQ